MRVFQTQSQFNLIKLILLLIFAFHALGFLSDDPAFPAHRDGEIVSKTVKIYRVQIGDSYYKKWKEPVQDLGEDFKEFLPYYLDQMLTFGDMNYIWNKYIENYSKYYYRQDKDMFEEMEIIALMTGTSFKHVFAYNFVYEMAAHKRSKHQMCTSVLILNENDEIIHGKNFDFRFQDRIGKMMIQFDYYKGDQLLFSTHNAFGMVSLQTGIRYGGYTVTMNERNASYSISNVYLLIKGAWSIQRYLFNKIKEIDNYQDFISALYNETFIAPFYLTVSSFDPLEGGQLMQFTVTKKPQIIQLTKENWVIVQTNCDIDDPDPDNRRTLAYQRIREIGRSITKDQLLNNVLLQFPNFNNNTIDSVIMNIQTNFFNTSIYWD